MAMPKLAANISWLFREWPFLDRFAAAADAGFQAVECLFPYDQAPEKVAQRLARNGLKLVMFNLPPGDQAAGERGLACYSGRECEFRASVQTALDFASVTGTHYLHMMAGNLVGDVAQAWTSYRRSLEFVSEVAGHHGINVLIEPLNGYDAPGYLLNDFAVAARLIEALKLPNLKLQFDIYHRQLLHGDVIRGLQTLMPVIGHIQVASVPLRQEPLSGELDDRHVFAAIDRLGYQGFVGCEYRPAAGTLEGLAWRERL